MLDAIRRFVCAMTTREPDTYCVSCWVCERIVETPTAAPWTTVHGDPFRPWSGFEACQECRDKRATTPDGVAYFTSLVADLDSAEIVLPDAETQISEVMGVQSLDLEGTECGTAVHVWNDGDYHRLPDWMRTADHMNYFKTMLPDVLEWRRRTAEKIERERAEATVGN